MTAGGAAECAHCGLTLPRRPASVTLEGRAYACCCYGCVLALTVTRSAGEGSLPAALLVRLGLAVFFTMNVMMVTLPTYAHVLYGEEQAEGPGFGMLRALGVLLATPVLALLGGPILASAAGAWRQGIGVDALVVLGTVAAYGVSVANVLTGVREVYVDTACMLLVLVTLGRYLEAQAKARASLAVRATLDPRAGPVRRLDGNEERSVAPETLAPGDRVVVAPGDGVPADGVIEEGRGGVDESLLTGEGAPRLCGPGDALSGGTCSVDGRFVVRITRGVADSAAARLAALLREALRTRTAAERLADRAAAVLGPVTVAVAALAGLWWWREAGIGRAVLVALAVLVVACPCALGIATPAAVWTAVGAAVRRGIVLRTAPILERLATTRWVLFDKTGTLTTGQPRVAVVEGPWAADEILRLAASLEADVPHPAARAIVDAAAAHAVQVAPASELQVLPGRGVTGRVDGRLTAVGNARGMHELGVAVDDDPGERWIWVAVDGRCVGRLGIEDTVRPEAAEAVAALREAGLAIGLVTGAARADDVVPAIVPASDAACGMRPEDKLALVRRLAESEGVAMVGDGLNDAPALAAASVGIAVGRAADLARIAADVVLLEPDLGNVPWLFDLSRRTVRIARQNLAWAIAYNGVALGLAAAGRLNPVVAALAMLASSATVLANARRLRSRPGALGGRAPARAPLTSAAIVAARP